MRASSTLGWDKDRATQNTFLTIPNPAAPSRIPIVNMTITPAGIFDSGDAGWDVSTSEVRLSE